MSGRREPDQIEPERYELFAGPLWQFALDRREFLGLSGGGLVVLLGTARAFAHEPQGRGRQGDRGLPDTLAAWLHIDEKGAITAFTGKVEVGQGSRTSLTQVVAEELRVPVETVRLVMGDTQRTPFDMGTFGSRTTPTMVPQLRRVAASARERLVELAAAEWQVEAATLTTVDGTVRHAASGRTIGFGELTKGRRLTETIRSGVRGTSPSDARIVGQPVAKIGARAIVTGRHRYPYDFTRPDMLHGKVLRAPRVGARLVRVDTAAIAALADIVVVHDGEFIGVAAPSEDLAARAIAAIEAEWDATPGPSASGLFERLRGTARRRRGEDAPAASPEDVRLQATYQVAYIAHAPLEPRVAVAEWTDSTLTVWTGTQRPFGVRQDLARAFRLPEEKIRVLVPDTGSGYGGKHAVEAAIEAARLAKTAGKPVRVAWTREEEFAWAYFRPAGVIEITSRTGRDGRIATWEHHNWNSGAAALRAHYAIDGQIAEFHRADSPLRQGSYRALAATANSFARETHVDEIARSLAMDPLALRLRNLDDARMAAVLDAAAGRFGWATRARREGRGSGIACAFEKGGYVATCVEVAVEGRQVEVARVATAFECGAILNPDNLRNQIEGALIMGLGGALFEAIDFENGEIRNDRFSRYRVPRFTDVPVLETVLVDRKDLPSVGAGETPMIALAPAIGSAIFDATGQRLRALPLVPTGLPG